VKVIHGYYSLWQVDSESHTWRVQVSASIDRPQKSWISFLFVLAHKFLYLLP